LLVVLAVTLGKRLVGHEPLAVLAVAEAVCNHVRLCALQAERCAGYALDGHACILQSLRVGLPSPPNFRTLRAGTSATLAVNVRPQSAQR
jgi:hypothetical protein